MPERLLDFVCLHESSKPCVANLSTAMRNFDSKLPFSQLTFLAETAKLFLYFFKVQNDLKIVSQRHRSSVLSAILNELVDGQSHVTGLFNIGDRAIV